MTNPVVAECDSVKIDLMKDFFNEQFKINESDESKAYWQVFDRTTNEEVKDWTYENGVVTVNGVTPWQVHSKLPCIQNLGRNFNVQSYNK